MYFIENTAMLHDSESHCYGDGTRQERWRTELLSEYGEVFKVVTAATRLFSVVFLATEVSTSEKKAKPGWMLKSLNNVLRTACMKCTYSSALMPLINLWPCETKS